MGIRAKIRDVALARDAIEVVPDLMNLTSWRTFEPGPKRMELTIVGGRYIRDRLRSCKGRVCEWEVEFPGRDKFGFTGELSKVTVKSKWFFMSKFIKMVVEEPASPQSRRHKQ